MAQSNPNLVDIFTDIAASIKAKTGETGLLYPVDFADEIAAIHTDPTLLEKNIVENGTYTAAQEGADGYSVVTVNVPQPNPLRDAWEAYKTARPTSWESAFYSILVSDNPNIVSYLTNIDSLSFAGSGNVTSMKRMFSGCMNLISVPLFDTGNVTNMDSMFAECSNLVSVPAFNVSKVTNFNLMFNNCSSLREVHMSGMAKSFNISASTNFTRTNLTEILANLATVESTQTLTMGETNLAKLTDADRAVALNKGWTLA